ncbi:MFS transporter [Desulfovibrio sp. OttesenSCG-928-C06]|nr:MFS transporter [Desulfovibrio sp. OttesenSCG-928-C06]
MEQAARFKQALPWVMLLSIMFFVNYTNRSIFGPLLVYIEADLGLNHSQTTGLLLYLSIGFTVSMALSSFVAARVYPLYLISISVCGSGLCLIAISQAHSVTAFTVLLIMLGAVAGLYMTSAMATMGTIIQPQLWTKSLALHELAPPLSFILGPLIAEAGVALGGSWRGAVIMMGCVSLVMSVVFVLTERGGRQKTNPPSLGGLKEALSMPILWFFAWSMAIGVVGEFVPYNILPLHLTFERGLSPDDANKLLSITRLLCPVAVLAGGFLTPRIGVRRTIQLFFSIQGATLIMTGLPWFGLALTGMFIQPLIAPFAFPAIFTMVTERIPLAQHPIIFGLAVPIGSCIGLGIVPKFMGIMGDHLSFSLGFMVLGVICFAGLPFCRLLRSTPKLPPNPA